MSIGLSLDIETTGNKVSVSVSKLRLNQKKVSVSVSTMRPRFPNSGLETPNLVSLISARWMDWTVKDYILRSEKLDS